MINQQVKEALNEKIQDGEFGAADIPAYLTLFCEMGNEIEDLQDEVEGWNRCLEIDMDGLGVHWIIIEDGQFSTGAGALDDANITLTMSAPDAAQIFAGDKDAQAAFMSGALKVTGDLLDAAKIKTLIEIIAEEIEY